MGVSIDKTYFIVGDKLERNKNINQQIVTHNIPNVVKFDAILSKNFGIIHNGKFNSGMIGCYISHLSVWKEAIRNGFKYVLVCEDDVSFNLNYQDKLHNCLESLPDNFDIALIGWNQQKECISTDINDNWCIPNRWWGTHCYIVNCDNMKSKISLFERMTNQIDIQICNKQKQGKINVFALKNKLSIQSGLRTTVQIC